MKPKKKDYSDYREYRRNESIQIFETILFTSIIKDQIQRTPLIYFVEAYMIIAEANNFQIAFSEAGMFVANNNHFKQANKILINSILYN